MKAFILCAGLAVTLAATAYTVKATEGLNVVLGCFMVMFGLVVVLASIKDAP